MIEKPRCDIFTIFQRFYELSVSLNSLWKPKNREICQIHATDFLNWESTCDSTDFPAPIYDRKTAARPFDTGTEWFNISKQNISLKLNSI